MYSLIPRPRRINLFAIFIYWSLVLTDSVLFFCFMQCVETMHSQSEYIFNSTSYMSGPEPLGSTCLTWLFFSSDIVASPQFIPIWSELNCVFVLNLNTRTNLRTFKTKKSKMKTNSV